MHSEHIENFTNISYTDYSVTDIKSGSEAIFHKKRKRSSDSKHFSKKEENRILQYALKLSAKEYKKQQSILENNKNGIKLKNIAMSSTFEANEEDFNNFIGYVDSCWRSQECTGVLKIIPPKNWVEDTKMFYENEIFPKIDMDEKKLPARIQRLSQLYQAKVINNLINNIFVIFIVNLFCYYFILYFLNYLTQFF